MDIERVTNAQGAIKEVFPDLKSAVTVTMAMAVVGAAITNRQTGTDPYPHVWQELERLAPRAYAPQLTFQGAALYVLEADALWLRALGEAPATGDER